MALVTEDGSGLAGAESLCAVAFADTYLSLRGLSLWGPLSTSEKEQALRRAADYMEQTYRARWAGSRKVATQALSWPRVDVGIKDARGAFLSSDSVPPLVQQAQALLAFKAASGDLSPDIERQVIREKIGRLETEYSPYAPAWTQFRAIDGMLTSLFRSSGSSVQVVRT